MAKKPPYVPPPDPDFAALADAAWTAFDRDDPQLVAFDTETTGLAFFDEPFCATLAWRSESVGIEKHYIEIERLKDGADLLYDLRLEDRALVGHNLKFDLQKGILGNFLDPSCLRPERLHDTEALAHLDDANREKGLKSLALSVLGWQDLVEVPYKQGPKKGQSRLVPREKAELDAVRREMKVTKDDGFHILPRAVVVPYAITDAELTLRLYEALRPRVERFPELWDLYEMEMRLTLTLLSMESAGLGLDGAYVKKKIKEYQRRVLLHDEKIEQIVGLPVGKGEDEFNPDSNQQLREFFEKCGHVRDSYDKDNLPTIDHPLARTLLERRADAKLLSTYFRAMEREQQDGILHPSFRQHGTKTGRMSSGGAEG